MPPTGDVAAGGGLPERPQPTYRPVDATLGGVMTADMPQPGFDYWERVEVEKQKAIETGIRARERMIDDDSTLSKEEKDEAKAALRGRVPGTKFPVPHRLTPNAVTGTEAAAMGAHLTDGSLPDPDQVYFVEETGGKREAIPGGTPQSWWTRLQGWIYDPTSKTGFTEVLAVNKKVVNQMKDVIPPENVQGRVTTREGIVYDAQGNEYTTTFTSRAVPTTGAVGANILGVNRWAGPGAPPVEPGAQPQTAPPTGAAPTAGTTAPPQARPTRAPETAPGPGAPRYGRLIGHKPLSAAEKDKLTTNSVGLTSAIEQIDVIRQNPETFGSLIDAGKISWSVDPTDVIAGIPKMVVARAFDLTPEQEKVATAFQLLVEHINLMRGPLGATGFRGPEAFAALQQQKGNLLARPGITLGVLKFAERNFRAFDAKNRQMLKTGNVNFDDIMESAIIGTEEMTPPGTMPPMPGRTAAPGKTLAPAAAAKLKEGVNTRFRNGEVWTLQNGKPKQLK
jgi:hypothetical protein